MYSKFRYIPYIFWKRRPIHLTLFVTRRCNSKCPFCFYQRPSTITSPLSDNTELSLEEIRKISSSIGSLLWLAFSGGEIFLRDDLVEITKIFYKKTKPSIILFSTNGLLTHRIGEYMEEILRYCKKSTVVVKLSLDGIGEAHDSLRGIPGSFKRTMETYYLLKEIAERFPNLEIGINTVFCSENQEKMEDIIEFVKKLKGVKTHTISLVRGEIPERFKEVDMERYLFSTQRLYKDLKKYSFSGARLKVAQDIIQHRLIYEISNRRRPSLTCYAGRLNIVITENGDLYPCEKFSKDMYLGNLRREGYDLKKILSSKRAEEVVSFIRRGCYCTHECYLMTNIFFNLHFYPSIFKEYLRILFS